MDRLPPRGAELRDLNTTKEAAEWLRIPTETMYVWQTRGKGPRGIKVGRQRLYSREALVAFVAQLEAGDARA